MFKKISPEEQLMNYLTKFRPLDILGFAALLKVEPQEDTKEFIVDIVATFSALDRKHRRELLKLARDVARANADLFKDEDKEELPNS